MIGAKGGSWWAVRTRKASRTRDADFDVLYGLCHAFGSRANREEADIGLRLWLAEACPEATVSVYLIDDEGRFLDQRLETTLQRRLDAAVNGKKPLLLINLHPEEAIATFPMVSRGDTFGVVELTGSVDGIKSSWNTIESIVSQGAILLRRLGVQRELEREIARLRDLRDVETRLATIAHELKSPIIGIRHAIESALGNGLTDNSSRLLHRSRNELEHLGDVVDGLLIHPQRVADVELFNLLTLVVETVDVAKRDADGHSVQVKGESIEVRADAALLRMAIINVIRNAIRHTPSGSAVSVMVEDAGPLARVSVLDSGPGVPEEDVDGIFDAYRRGKGAVAPGVGLGLFITRTIVESQGGSVEVGKSPSGGASFTLEIPRVPVSVGLHDVS